MLEILKSLAVEAGARIMEIYAGEMGVTTKEDASPLTLADQASHTWIVKGLSNAFPGIPIISEEGDLPSHAERLAMPRFFLVDPLDGTKEFIKRNGEFTVNIALVEGVTAVAGVVYLPAMGQLYAAERGKGATLTEGTGEAKLIHASTSFNPTHLTASMSRSHPSPDLDQFIAALGEVVPVNLGSALKFCRVAEGKIDFYPRFGGLMEWDTAAAQVVAEEAGAVVLDLAGNRLSYNKPELKHTGLICASHAALGEYLMARVPKS